MARNPRIEFGQQVYQYFLDKGLAPHRAAAIAGNIAWEGGGRTDGINIGDNPKYPNAPHSYGVSQWNGDRLVGLINYARSQGADIPAGSLADPNYLRSISSKLPLETQLGYVWSEMQGPEKGAYSRIEGAPDIRAATAGAIGYHRPAGYHPSTPEAGHGFGGRLTLAQQIAAAGGMPLPGSTPTPAPYDMYGEDARKTPAPMAVAEAPRSPTRGLAPAIPDLFGPSPAKAPSAPSVAGLFGLPTTGIAGAPIVPGATPGAVPGATPEGLSPTAGLVAGLANGSLNIGPFSLGGLTGGGGDKDREKETEQAAPAPVQLAMGGKPVDLQRLAQVLQNRQRLGIA